MLLILRCFVKYWGYVEQNKVRYDAYGRYEEMTHSLDIQQSRFNCKAYIASNDIAT
jgi:hypothetical protein